MQKLFFTFTIYVVALGYGFAQSSFFNARLSLQKIDCNRELVQLEVQIAQLVSRITLSW
ncbi:MAG: hypothetical protein R2822_12550 [Spirosomataceae bacterium]